MREIFVFGSNLAGRHGAGSAKHAVEFFGAVHGVGEGIQGDSYAIPTKDALLNTLPLADIHEAVLRFLDFAQRRPQYRFQLVRVGCGLAGYTDRDMAPMFLGAPPNVILPAKWRHVLANITAPTEGL